MPDNPDSKIYAMHSFGAQFAEVRVNADTGEIRVPRMLGIFSAGRIINPRLARSQLIGGMTMGISAALFEQSIVDPRFGHVVTLNFADYHIASSADVGALEAAWLDETDEHSNPMGRGASARSASSARPPQSPTPPTMRPGSGSATCRSLPTSSSNPAPEAGTCDAPRQHLRATA
jgi:CO/xanthine dehydrogenase Mo-binding subunit